MKKGWKIVLAILCAFVIAAGSFIAAVQYLNTRYAAALSAREEDSPVQAKAAEVQEIIETYFIDDYDEDTLADGAASGMVDATGDEWSYYLSADEVAAYEESMANAYVGVGITITEDAEAGGMRVEEVAAGGPAEEAGIRVGDLLLAVEGEDVLPLGIDGTRNLVRGEEGTHVNMHFSRNGTEYDVSVERRSIETPVVTGELLDGNIGYIKIDNFDERSAAETIAFVKDLIGQGAEALLFDVRFNPGRLCRRAGEGAGLSAAGGRSVPQRGLRGARGGRHLGHKLCRAADGSARERRFLLRGGVLRGGAPGIRVGNDRRLADLRQGQFPDCVLPLRWVDGQSLDWQILYAGRQEPVGNGRDAGRSWSTSTTSNTHFYTTTHSNRQTIRNFRPQSTH